MLFSVHKVIFLFLKIELMNGLSLTGSNKQLAINLSSS